MRKSTRAPNITFPTVKGDVTITGDVNTGRNDRCALCGREICEVEIWNHLEQTLTGRYKWIHFDSRHGMACLGAKPKRCKER